MTHLARVNITPRSKGLIPGYVAFNDNNTPILLGEFMHKQYPTSSADTVTHQLKQEGELSIRKWLFAACTWHRELEDALPMLSRACARDCNSKYSYSPVPALDMWTTMQETEKQ